MTSHPSRNPIVTAYVQGKDPTLSIGSHWQQPLRSILNNHPLNVPDWSRKVCRISEGVLYWLVFFLNINIFMQILTSVYGKATLSQKSCAKSSPWTVFINIFRLGAHCIGDIGRKLRDGLRGGREKAARRRYRSRFPWLPCWLKWEQVEQILWLKKSFFLMSHDV